MNNLFDNVLIPFVTGAILMLFLCLLSATCGAHESALAAVETAHHDCRLTGTYKTMECASAIIRSPDGSYRVNPITVGTERMFKLHLNLERGDTLVCLFHTHPGRDANADVFSDLDVRVSEKLGVPSYIYVLRAEKLRVYYPLGRILASANVSAAGAIVVVAPTAIGSTPSGGQ